DIKMPGMDGFEVCRRIKSNEKLQKTKVVMMTGCHDKDTEEDSFKSGADEYIKKPFKIEEIFSILDNIFKN
ncbi:response regulator, partial [bacterium]|nr:response regulator [bacterium]